MRSRSVAATSSRARRVPDTARPARRGGGVGARASLATLVGLALVVMEGGVAAAREPEAAIRADDADRHVAALADDALEGREGGTRGGRAAGAYVADVLRAAGLRPAGDEGTYFQRFGSMRNILAFIPGADPVLAGEMVVVGAHYDHVGYGTTANSNGPVGLIHNGADDNASGVAGVLEIAEALAAPVARPRRGVLVALWDGEEKGLLGSRHFLRSRPAALGSTTPVFALNLDMIGRLRGDRVEVYGGRSAAGLRRTLVDANRTTGLELAFDWELLDDSDHFPFIESGIPALMLHTGLHDEYHRPDDDAHLVNAVGIETVTRLALATIRAVADAPARPDFRADCRREGKALCEAIEKEVPVEPGTPPPRWGMSTRGDAGDPAAPVVVRVVPGTPLASAGLEVRDRILAIDGVGVRDHADMLRRVQAAGETMTLSIDRKGRSIELTARRGRTGR